MAKAVPAILPLVSRHAADAAFYWSQHERSAHSPLVGLAQLQEHDRLLDAHLDGLRTAGQAGWDLALQNLSRWKGPAETFVCSMLALEQPLQGDNPKVAQVLKVVTTNPQRMLRGLISALAWSSHRDTWQKHWVSVTHEPIVVVAAWRSRALLPGALQPALAKALPQACESEAAPVRAAACRMLATAKPEWLEPLLQDPVREVRAEAAIGRTAVWSQLSSQQQTAAATALWKACKDLIQELPALGTGIERTRAEHRLARWIRHAGLVVPCGSEGVAKLIEHLPPRLGLWLVLHHGDAHYLPWVVQQMGNPDVARLAGWVWACMTGIDLQSNNLALPPPALNQKPRPTDSEDPGLVEPDRARIQGMAVNLAQHVPCLLGKPLDKAHNTAHLNYILWDTPQALRWIAAQRLRMQGLPSLNTRAPAQVQLDSQGSR